MNLKPLNQSSGTVCILAGGQSRRMGKPKPNVVLRGRSFLDWVKTAAQSIGWPVVIIDQDRVAGLGPLGGIETAFSQTKSELLLFLSCDMPFVDRALLQHLIRQLRQSDSGVFTVVDGFVGFPFLLRRSAWPHLTTCLEANTRSLQTLASTCAARRWKLPVILNATIRNINTPDDLRAAEASLDQQDAEGSVLMLKDLLMRRDSIPILCGIHWTVRKGEHWVILGANGSGKTSLLSAITGYMTPTGGHIWALGKKYGRSDWRQLRKKIGLVSSSIRQMMAESEPALHTVASGRAAVIDSWGTPSKTDLSAARKILRLVECDYLADRAWSVLSQGERQRILIGRALMARPNLLILDEPCAGLDPVARERFLEFIERLGNDPAGPTLVLVTHHVEEITPAFTHVLMLREGKVLASGPRKHSLNSKNLSATFGADIKLRAHGARLIANIKL